MTHVPVFLYLLIYSVKCFIVMSFDNSYVENMYSRTPPNEHSTQATRPLAGPC